MFLCSYALTPFTHSPFTNYLSPSYQHFILRSHDFLGTENGRASRIEIPINQFTNSLIPLSPRACPRCVLACFFAGELSSLAFLSLPEFIPGCTYTALLPGNLAHLPFLVYPSLSPGVLTRLFCRGMLAHLLLLVYPRVYPRELLT